MKPKSYKYNKSWWDVMSGLSDADVSALCRAINGYVFDGIMPELSGVAAGVWASIKRDIDQAAERQSAISIKRAEAGRTGNARRWSKTDDESQNIANVANAITHRNCDKNIANATENVANAIETDENIAKIAIAINPPTPPYINNNIITTTTNAHACVREEFDIVFGWLTSNDLVMEAQLKSKRVITRETPHDEMIELLRPLAREYYTFQLEAGVTFKTADIARNEKNGEVDTQRHFGSWLRKQKVQMINGKPTSRTNDTQTVGNVASGVPGIAESGSTKADYRGHF